MPTLTSSLEIIVKANYQNAADLGNAVNDFEYKKKISLTNGTGADQADKLFHDQRAIDPSQSEELDLNGSLIDIFGNTLAFTKIKFMIIVSDENNGDNLEVGGAASNAFFSIFKDSSDISIIRPGGFEIFACKDATGYGVTAGSADRLKILNANSGAEANYDIIIIGT